MLLTNRGQYTLNIYNFYDAHSHFSQFSCSVVSDSLLPHGLQNARPPCALPSPGVYPNSCRLSM